MVPLWPVPLSETGDVRVALVLTWSCAVGSVQGGTGQSVGPPPPPPPPPELPPTVNVALRICVTLVVVTTRVVIVWLPLPVRRARQLRTRRLARRHALLRR